MPNAPTGAVLYPPIDDEDKDDDDDRDNQGAEGNFTNSRTIINNSTNCSSSSNNSLEVIPTNSRVTSTDSSWNKHQRSSTSTPNTSADRRKKAVIMSQQLASNFEVLKKRKVDQMPVSADHWALAERTAHLAASEIDHMQRAVAELEDRLLLSAPEEGEGEEGDDDILPDEHEVVAGRRYGGPDERILPLPKVVVVAAHPHEVVARHFDCDETLEDHDSVDDQTSTMDFSNNNDGEEEHESGKPAPSGLSAYPASTTSSE